MNRNQRQILLLTVVVALFAPPRLAAQTPAPYLRVTAGQDVLVVMSDGTRWYGRVTGRPTATLGLIAEGRVVRLSAVDIARITTAGDSVLDGLGKGALAGAVSGLGLALFGVATHDGGPTIPTAGEFTLYLTALGAGIGAGIGLVVDASRSGTRTVYRKERSLTVMPLVSRHIVGVGGVIRW